jgi:hypothetical protein
MKFMVNNYETLKIDKIAGCLTLRRKTQNTTILVLGSRAGSLFRNGFLYDTLNLFQTGGINRVSLPQRFAACFHMLNTLNQEERDEIIRTAHKQIKVEEADIQVAQLAKRGFFNMLVTTNITTMLEEAFTKTGMREQRDVTIFTGTSGTATNFLSEATGRRSLFTFVKALGDLVPDVHSKSAKNLDKLMDDIRDWNVLLVGLDPVWDQHLMQKLFPRNGIVWYVNEEQPSENTFLARHLFKCKAECILGREGQYELFFHTLSDLIGDSDSYRSTPKSVPEDIEQTVVLQRSLQARVQEVLKKEQSPPKSLTATVHRLYSSLPIGICAYYDAQTMPLIQYTIKNEDKKAVTVVLAAEIKGYSYLQVDTVEVPGQSQKLFYQLPRLDTEKVSMLTKITGASMYIRISYLKEGVELPYKEVELLYKEGVELPYNGETQLHSEQNIDVFLTPRNVIRWVVPDIAKGSGFLSLLNHIAAWVTPNNSAVKTMLRSAKDCHPQKALIGYPLKDNPDLVRSQVKAIFEALKKVGKIAHINSPFVVGTGVDTRLQTIHFPRESLSAHQANCIDGAVLYASLMECARLHPLIVIQTSHAFVGWKPWKDAPLDEYEFLETTMTSSHSFEDAYTEGMKRYHQLQERLLFNHEPFASNGFAHILDIKMLRDERIVPME